MIKGFGIPKIDRKISKFEKDSGKYLSVGGFVSDIRKIKTRNGSDMAFVQIKYGEKVHDLVLFPNLMGFLDDELVKNNIVLIDGQRQNNYDSIVPIRVSWIGEIDV